MASHPIYLDVNAIIYTHPVYATAFAIAKKAIPVVTIEMAGLVGSNVPVAKFVLPGTRDLGKEVVRTLGKGVAVLLQNHGLITVALTLNEALDVTMAVEQNAKLSYLATTLSRSTTIPKQKIAKIKRYIEIEYGQPRSIQSRLK